MRGGINDFVMPERLDSDPEPDMLRVYRVGRDHLAIELGNGQSYMVSEYNAARVCAALAMFLKLRFHPSHAKKLVLTQPKKVPGKKP